MRAQSILIFISILHVVLVKAVPSNKTRIVGGEIAKPGQFPYQAGISFQRRGEREWCGGSILSERWILTAGHCVYNVDPGFKVFVGITNRMMTYVGQEFEITNPANLIIHENYDDSFLKNDIGLIRLEKDIQFNENVAKVKLVRRENANDEFVGRTSVASGWGKLGDDDPYVNDNLHYVDLDPISNSECQIEYGDYINDDNLCVATAGKSICSGDSGGPLVTLDSHEQIGISSFVSADGCEGDIPAVFVRVSKYLDWIQSKTANCLK